MEMIDESDLDLENGIRNGRKKYAPFTYLPVNIRYHRNVGGVKIRHTAIYLIMDCDGLPNGIIDSLGELWTTEEMDNWYLYHEHTPICYSLEKDWIEN